ncbi:ABC transporter permease [Brackiella oedipodis]|uniref:ABC transporter permease n=1 Tax=Brackiella oedipodis TaxID=124225 RepID=UPI00056F1B7B|nr:ABC transporter permease [Brackiella oedipodis]
MRQEQEIRFGSGFPTLFKKEIMRFGKVWMQTVLAPVVTSALYLLVFSHVLEDRVSVYGGQVPYIAFLIPGLVMMSMLQNSFANVSSSLMQSRITGNLIFILLPPLSPYEIYFAYVLAGVSRGLLVGIVLWLASAFFHLTLPQNFLWVGAFSLFACGIMAALGLVAGLWSEKFDQLAVFQNFLILPATFLSGVFYSIHSLPIFWQHVSAWSPVFYMIDGLRFGFFGVSDVSPWQSLLVVAITFVLVSAAALRLLVTGYKLRY